VVLLFCCGTGSRSIARERDLAAHVKTGYTMKVRVKYSKTAIIAAQERTHAAP